MLVLPPARSSSSLQLQQRAARQSAMPSQFLGGLERRNVRLAYRSDTADCFRIGPVYQALPFPPPEPDSSLLLQLLPCDASSLLVYCKITTSLPFVLLTCRIERVGGGLLHRMKE